MKRNFLDCTDSWDQHRGQLRWKEPIYCFDSLLMPWRNWILGGDRVECSTRYQCPSKHKMILEPWLNIVGRIFVEASGSTFVYKEYSYHLRQACDFMMPIFVIEETDQRQPPPNELLTKLGTVYTEWEVHEAPFGSSVLRLSSKAATTIRQLLGGWRFYCYYP